MKQRSTDTAAAEQAAAAAPPLPTQGGVFEFNPSTQTMRQIDGAAAEAGAPQAPTGEQA
ncbi:MAG: hypothetical protein ABL896_14700 [Hylemonella sp.]